MFVTATDNSLQYWTSLS